MMKAAGCDASSISLAGQPNWSGWDFRREGDGRWLLAREGEPNLSFTTHRDAALEEDTLQLIGLEHPVISQFMRKYSVIGSGSRAVAGKVKWG